jgi:hypothetical protein
MMLAASQLDIFDRQVRAPAAAHTPASPSEQSDRKDHAFANRGARGRLLELLSDLAWHHHTELETAARANRYGARLLELRRLGYEIESHELDVGRRYRLVSTTPGAPQAKRVRLYLTAADALSIVYGNPTPAVRCAVQAALESFAQNVEKL